MTNVNQAPLPRLSKRRWYVLRLLSGAISSTWLYLFYLFSPLKQTLDAEIRRKLPITWRSVNSEIHDDDGLLSVDRAEQRQQLKDLDEDATVRRDVVPLDLVGEQVEVIVVKLLDS